MDKKYEALTDLQWQLLEPLFPKPLKRGRGKPHTPWRAVANSVLWVLTTGNKWSSIPVGEEFASKSASHRWFVAWEKSGFLEELFSTYKGFREMAKLIPPQRRNRHPSKAVEFVQEAVSQAV